MTASNAGKLDSPGAPPGETGARATLEERLACPACPQVSALRIAATDAATCPACNTAYPLLRCDGTVIPWAFPEPAAAFRAWSLRLRGFLLTLRNEHNRLNRALADERLSDSGRRRIGTLLIAKRMQRQQVLDILSPVGLDCEDVAPAATNILRHKLPRNQALSSYADNVFRDWAWDNGENEALLEAVAPMVGAADGGLGAVLCLGAGACRLPYDLHRRYSPRLTVALDLNPLLLSVAARVIRGGAVSLHEFPTAPVDEAACAVLGECRAPVPLPVGPGGAFRFVLGDAARPPFLPASFDTVFTPWLIDVIQEDLYEFLPQVNRLLPRGGVWINTGPLAFIHDDPRRCYSEGEVLEIVASCGFEIIAVDRRNVPYLRSPHSAHGRIERITSFAARKRADAEIAIPAPALPEWILDTKQAVPTSTESVLSSSSHLLLAQVWAAIDGQRSIDAIARLVAREYGLSVAECADTIQRIFADAWNGQRLDTL